MNILILEGLLPKLVTWVREARLTSSWSAPMAAPCTVVQMATRLVRRLERSILSVGLKKAWDVKLGVYRGSLTYSPPAWKHVSKHLL
jgi:hypothetical protein